MISVSEAKAIIEKSIVQGMEPVVMPILEALGHVLAQDVEASIDIPAFEQSSRDGYAIRYTDKNESLKIVGEIAAGSMVKNILEKGEAMRIFTGAPLPDGADTVIMQENTRVHYGTITCQEGSLQKGSYVRHRGAEISAGSLALQKNTHLSPASIGFLAGIGVGEVSVYPLPSVSIIITGKELQLPGKKLIYGQVYESNSYSLRAALQQVGIRTIQISEADDEVALVRDKLKRALIDSDLVLVTGGVSVGDYDVVVEAAEQCGVKKGFHTVSQRPGKPLYFGMKDRIPVFGLPGNPSSVLTCFYNFVLPVLERLSNRSRGQKIVHAQLTKSGIKSKGLTHFLKGYFERGSVTPLGAQESFQLSSFAMANCLICLQEDKADYQEGEIVEVLLLPHPYYHDR